VTAVAGEHRVGVRIDEAGKNGEVVRVDDQRVGWDVDRVIEIGGTTGKDDPALRAGEGAVSNDLDVALCRAASRSGAGTRDELTAVTKDEVSDRLTPFVGDARRFNRPLRLNRVRASRVRVPRTMEQQLVVGPILFADELERAIERLDGRLERSFDVAAAQPHLVDVALDFLEPALRLLKQQVRASLRLAHDQFLALAMLGEKRLLSHQVLTQAIDLAQRMLVIVGRFGQEGDDLGGIEAFELRAEALLPQIERRDPHHALGRGRSRIGG
jgi:hypothetical protein